MAAFTWIAAAPSAEARPHRGHHRTTIVVTGHTSWGAPIRSERYFVRYDHCGRVIWGYRRLPVARPYCPPPRHYSGYDRGPRRGYDRSYDRGYRSVDYSYRGYR